jgi:hypothetical protein
VASVLLIGGLGYAGHWQSRYVLPVKTLKYPLPSIAVTVDVALSLSVKADTVSALSTEHSESNGEHVPVSRVLAAILLVQHEHR